MSNLTNKDLEFLSNPELITLLESVLREIDIVASHGAHRSTTYLAVSAIEGLFGELVKLLKIQGSQRNKWPTYPKNHSREGQYLDSTELSLNQRESILKAEKVLPANFENFYKSVRTYRNYMHPDRELVELKPINQSVAQLALACLNALIEHYSSLRFVAAQKWQLVYGLARVLEDNTVHMPQNPGDPVSLSITYLPAEKFKEMSFKILIEPDAIFDFVYNYFSKDQFMAARIEGRVGPDGRGADNGRLVCRKWRKWSVNGRYANEPSPLMREHTMEILMDPLGTFELIVDQVPLELEHPAQWDFDAQGKIGFMTECGAVSITDVTMRER